MATLPKTIYRCSAIPMKTPIQFLVKLENIILNFIWKHKKSNIDKIVLNNERTDRGITISDFILIHLFLSYEVCFSPLYSDIDPKTDTP